MSRLRDCPSCGYGFINRAAGGCPRCGVRLVYEGEMLFTPGERAFVWSNARNAWLTRGTDGVLVPVTSEEQGS